MVIPGGAGISAASGLSRVYQPQSQNQTFSAPQTQREDFARRFDSVSISTPTEGGPMSPQGLELRGKLVQELRASSITSSDAVLTLREQILNGTYRIDPHEIAKKMLLMGEVV